MIAEWNEYLDYELATLTRAILGAVPAAGSLASSQSVRKISDPDQIAALFDSLGAATHNG